jgi:ParB/RepB/Spo0J family partition protein
MADGTTAAPELAHYDTKLIDESPTNPRKTFHEIDELAESLKSHGQLEPCLVRPKGKRLELVFGARRYRAAKLAQLTLWCAKRELTDAQVLEIQIIENSQRNDVHPLEEAEGYEALQKTHGYSVEVIAAKVHKPVAHVIKRLRLCTLIPEARKAYHDGKLTLATAFLLARIPLPELQKRALEAMCDQDERYVDEDGPMTEHEARRLIEQDFMLRLQGAPFDREDANLVPNAGPCTTCPKRTGNQAELFADVKATDTCTDVKCFGLKKEAGAKVKLAVLEEKGVTILPQSEAKKLFPHGHSSLAYNSAFVNLDDKNYQDAKSRTYRQILKGSDVKLSAIKAPDGTVVELAPRAAAERLLKAANKNRTGVATSNNSRAAEVAKQRQRRAVAAALIKKVVEVAATKGLPPNVWRTLARCMAESNGHDTTQEIGKRRELVPAKRQYGGPDHTSGVKKLVERMTESEAIVFVVESIATAGAFYVYRENLAFGLKEMCALYKVDVSKVTAAVKAEIKAKKKKPKGTSAKKSPARDAKATKKAGKAVGVDVGTCRVCGCTDDDACPDGCEWVEPDLCSACADEGSDGE